MQFLRLIQTIIKRYCPIHAFPICYRLSTSGISSYYHRALEVEWICGQAQIKSSQCLKRDYSVHWISIIGSINKVI